MLPAPPVPPLEPSVTPRLSTWGSVRNASETELAPDCWIWVWSRSISVEPTGPAWRNRVPVTTTSDTELCAWLGCASDDADTAWSAARTGPISSMLSPAARPRLAAPAIAGSLSFLVIIDSTPFIGDQESQFDRRKRVFLLGQLVYTINYFTKAGICQDRPRS